MNLIDKVEKEKKKIRLALKPISDISKELERMFSLKAINEEVRIAS
jgi:hypothetical protein